MKTNRLDEIRTNTAIYNDSLDFEVNFWDSTKKKVYHLLHRGCLAPTMKDLAEWVSRRTGMSGETLVYGVIPVRGGENIVEDGICLWTKSVPEIKDGLRALDLNPEDYEIVGVTLGGGDNVKKEVTYIILRDE